MKEYCVTGGTGFIASHLIRALLAHGHTVRATVRNPGDEEKVGFLKRLDGANERLKLVKADLLVEGSFDEAVDGVDGVFHTASPVFMSQAETLINSAVNGTLNVLRSCTKASTVKRVVFTSSCSTIRHCQPTLPLNESHWSDPDYCNKYNMWYPYAKTLAEKAAWQLAKESNMDLVVVNPSLVIGPSIAPQPTSTIEMTMLILKGKCSYPNMTVGFVHIDDVVLAHVMAMENPRASGRLICSGTVHHWSEILEMLRAKYPSYPMSDKYDEREGDANPHTMDTTKICGLGFPAFKTVDQMFDDCIKDLQEKGLL